MPTASLYTERFWKKVKRLPNGCWQWTGCLARRGGYGALKINGKYVPAHHVGWFMERGSWASQLNHVCDNAGCVNPGHMYIGTQSENMRDMYTRGRHPVKARKGDDHPSKKLSSMQVSWIRQLRGKGFSQRQLARFFGVHEGSVSAIIRGITWKQA